MKIAYNGGEEVLLPLRTLGGREKAVCKVYGEPYLGSRSYEELEWQRVQQAALE